MHRQWHQGVCTYHRGKEKGHRILAMSVLEARKGNSRNRFTRVAFHSSKGIHLQANHLAVFADSRKHADVLRGQLLSKTVGLSNDVCVANMNGIGFLNLDAVAVVCKERVPYNQIPTVVDEESYPIAVALDSCEIVVLAGRSSESLSWVCPKALRRLETGELAQKQACSAM